MKRIVLILTAAVIFAWQGISFAASSVDALIQKLEDKGIITEQEGNQIKGEVAAKDKANQEASFKTLLPEWLNTLKITGDLRLRDQVERKKTPVSASTTDFGGHSATYNRGRVRARLNFEDQINDKVKVVVGIATDGESAKSGQVVGNPRSNNITFGGNNTNEGSFSKSTIILNKAYVVYKPISEVTLMGGQMDNPIWEPTGSSLLWDPDITPQGGAILLEKRLNDYITPFSINSAYVVKNFKDETFTTSLMQPKTDPYIFTTQNGIKGNLTEKIYYKGAFTYMTVQNPTRLKFDDLASGNTASSVNSNYFKYNFNLLGGAVDVGINDPFGEMLPSPINVAQVGLMGSFFQNVSASGSDVTAMGGYTGRNMWLMGAYMGNSAINGWGTWKLSSYYKVIESDAWISAFPDDDFYSGNTNVAGWRSQMDIGLMKNVWFTMAYFQVGNYKYVKGSTSGDVPLQLFQFDLNFKF